MRPKFVLALVAFAVFVVAAAIYFKQSPAPPPNQEKTAAVPEPTAPSTPVSVVPPPTPVVAPAPKPMTPEDQAAYIQAESDKLMEWSTQNDPASLSNILSDLTNSTKEVRLAAIEAAKQFGSKEAIPVLQADVASATDTDEKVALLEAADFLTLPSIADNIDNTPRTPEQLQAMQQARDRAAARRQFLQQKHAQNQGGVPPPDQSTPPPQDAPPPQ